MTAKILAITKRPLSNKKVLFFLIALIAFLLVVIAVASLFVIFNNNNKSIPDNRVKPLDQENLQTREKIEAFIIPPLDSLNDGSNQIKPEVFGYSVQGRAIYGYIFGKGDETILLMGAIHGNEKSSYTLLKNMVKEINSNQNAVSKNKRVIIIPLVNPDGYNVGFTKVNFRNVNLNLNFQTTGWKKYGGEDNRYFAGDAPFSEPESRIIRDIVSKYGVDKMLSYHAKGTLINPEIHAPSEDLARWYVGQTGYSFYEDISWDYPGTATKWFTESVEGPAITIELPDFNYPDIYTHKKAIFELIK